MKVKRWMNHPPITTHPELPVYLAHRKMVENGIRRLPVVTDRGRLVGIISERDARTVLLPREITTADQEIVPQDEPFLVRDIMTRVVVVVHPDDPINDAVRAMHDHKISGLPVVDGGICVGVITVQDLLEVLTAALDRHTNEVKDEILRGIPPAATGHADA